MFLYYLETFLKSISKLIGHTVYLIFKFKKKNSFVPVLFLNYKFWKKISKKYLQ